MPKNDDAFADARMRKVSRRLNAIYRQASEELTEKVDSFFDKFREMDEKKAKLVEEGKLSEREYKEWRKNKMLMGKNYQDLRDTMTERMQKADELAVAYMNGELPAVYAHNFNRVGEDAEALVRGFSFDLVNEEAIRKLSTSDKTLLPYKIVDGKRNTRWNTKHVNSAILQGILQGESIPKIAKRLMNVTQMNKASSIRNARTAITGAQNKGRYDAMDNLAQAGLPIRKQWIATTGDGRTREAHLELHMSTMPYDKPFQNSIGRIMYPGDPNAHPSNVYNCRCSLVSDFSEVLKNMAPNDTPAPTEAERKTEEYKSLLERRKALKSEQDTLNAEEYNSFSPEKWKAQSRLERMKNALEQSDRYSKYDQYMSEEELQSSAKALEQEIKDIYEELEEMRRNRPRVQNYEEKDYDQYEKDFEAFAHRREELQGKVAELEKRLHYAVMGRPSWSDIELYREAKNLGLAEIEKQLNDLKAEKERRQERLQSIGDEMRKISDKIRDEYPVQQVVAEMQEKKVAYNEPVRRELSNLIDPLAGGDKTEGSCASLALCYAARRQGIDMLDFRDGDSREEIAQNSKALAQYFAKKTGTGAIESAKSWTTAGHKTLAHAEEGKEYYLSCAKHAAIVRRNSDGWIEYLELQSGREGRNTWHPLGGDNAMIDEMLCWRFGASKRGDGYNYTVAMFDISALKDDSEFLSLLGYINTAEDAQRKGMEGHER